MRINEQLSTEGLNIVLGDNGWVRICLDKPRVLNALNTTICIELKAVLAQLAIDDSVKAIWLESSIDRAFCAGGDVRALRQSMLDNHPDQVQAFFNAEYALDLAMHDYAKPIVVWGDGYIMGGGMGLFMAAPFRILTPQSVLAMPEINIGLFPDVGGSRFLSQRGDVGLFLGLTGSQIGAADSHSIGWATHVAEVGREAAYSQIERIDWAAYPAGVYRAIDDALTSIHRPQVGGQLQEHLDLIHSLCKGEDFVSDYTDIGNLSAARNPWLKEAALNLKNGSPSTAAITWLLWQWAKAERSWVDVFVLEEAIAVWKTSHPDFVEGVRARLVDKDMQPKWLCTQVDSLHSALGGIAVVAQLSQIPVDGWQAVLQRYVLGK